MSHRQSVIESLNSLLSTQKENFLLLRRECCSFSNLEYVKAGLAELEHWCGHAQEEILSIQRLYRICTLYLDENYNTLSISPDVISDMKIQMTEESNEADVKSFLLDDNSSIPFSVDDISTCLQDSNFRGLKPAAELLGNPAFEFLQ